VKEMRRVGHYEPRIVKKGFEETSLDVPEGEAYWLIRLDRYSGMDVKTQFEAEVISRLVRIENLLKTRTKK
jgi:hypothetical protein